MDGPIEEAIKGKRRRLTPKEQKLMVSGYISDMYGITGLDKKDTTF